MMDSTVARIFFPCKNNYRYRKHCSSSNKSCSSIISIAGLLGRIGFRFVLWLLWWYGCRRTAAYAAAAADATYAAVQYAFWQP